MSNVAINIAAEFTGKRAFKKADKATTDLMKNVKSLAKTLGVAYSASTVLAFAKSSVRAAAQDEKAQKQLGLALKNVGLERDVASSEDYIQRLQSEFGVVDDKLRPAYQTLAVATKDSALSQRLFNIALDISASTGKDLSTVTSALSKAYLGSNTALSKLGVGISKADLKAKSFDDIVNQLGDTFKGSATAATKTFQGSIDKLSVATNNAKETIGTGLIDALRMLGNEDSVDNLASSMQDAAIYTADVIRGIGVLASELKKLPGVSSFNVGMIPVVGSYLQILRNKGASKGGGFPQGAPSDLTALGKYSSIKSDDKVQKNLLKVNKDALKLAKAKAMFDMQKIQIEAALKGKITEEERIRLKLMQAIEEENITQIEKYTKLLDEAQKKTIELRDALKVVNPFESWLTGINAVLAGMFSVGTQIQANGKEWSSFANLTATTSIQSNLKEWSSSFSPSATTTAQASPVVNNVTVNAGVGDPEAIARVIEDTLRQSKYRGTGSFSVL